MNAPVFRPPAHDLRSPWPLLLFISVLLVTYGYEIFSFNLTIDEEVTASVGRLTRAEWSLAEGRWSMAALTVLIPNPVAPAVSTALGVGLAGVSWWILSRRFLGLSPWAACGVAAVAATVPTLAFTFSFMTIAYAVGVGHLFLLGFAAGISSSTWPRRILGVLAGAAAIGIYDTFVVAIAAIALGLVIHTPTIKNAAIALGGTVVAFATSRVIGLLASFITGQTQGAYTSGFFDIAGFVTHPLGRTRDAITDVLATFFVAPDRFGLTSPWLGILMIVMTVLAAVAVVLGASTARGRIIRIVAFALLLALPVVVEAIGVVVVLRSMIYLPVIVLVIGSLAVEQLARLSDRSSERLSERSSRIWVRSVAIAAVGLVALTVVGNAIVSNRLFSIAGTTYSLDRQLAFEIGEEKNRLLYGLPTDIPLVIAGRHAWPSGAFTEVHETIGLSFFDLDERRAIAFLHGHGVTVIEPTEAQQKRLEDDASRLPPYPYDGWMEVRDGVLLMNLGEAP